MDIFVGFLCVFIFAIFIEIGKLFLINWYLRKQSIEDVKETIITCLDKDLKFCIKTKGTPEWNDVSHVLYKMPVQRAFELIHQYENNYE